MSASESPARTRLERYEPTEIEPRWQARWEELGLHRTDLRDTSRAKYYLLTMYDYPSGDLHIGHWYVKTPTDAIGRYRRMNGWNVFFPVGFDAFGLPGSLDHFDLREKRPGHRAGHLRTGIFSEARCAVNVRRVCGPRACARGLKVCTPWP